MTKEEHKEIERTKRLSIIEGNFSVLQTSFGTNNIVPYAIAIGGNNPHLNTFVGFLSSFPSLLGNISQIFTYKLLERYSRKQIVSLFVFLQSIMWIGIILSGALLLHLQVSSTISLSMLVFFYSLLIFFGAFAGPAWTSLMKDLVVTNKGAYFGKRNTINGIISLTAFLIAGTFLNYLDKPYILYGFFLCFIIAFFGRSISAFLFTKHYYPEFKIDKTSYFSFFEFVKRMPHNNFGKFTMFIATFTLSVAIASPFFTVYMFNQLNLSYIQWTFIVLTTSIFTLIFSPFWGRFADKYGNLSVLKLTGFFIPFIPVLYIVANWIPNKNTVFLVLCISEVFSGIFWSGFNLSASNFIYDAVTKQRITICSAYYSLINGVGTFIGATIGGILTSMSISLFSFNSILIVFGVSMILRLLVYLFMINRIKEVREVECFDIKQCIKAEVPHWAQKPFNEIGFNLRRI